MKIKFIAIPILFAPFLKAGGDKNYAHFCKSWGLQPEEYVVDELFAKAGDWAMSLGYKALKTVPFVGKLANLDVEMLMAARRQLTTIRKVANEARRTKEHIERLYNLQKDVQDRAKRFYASYENAGMGKLLLTVAQKKAQIDLNPSHYFPSGVVSREFREKWDIALNDEEDFLRRIESVLAADPGLMAMFLSKTRLATNLAKLTKARELLAVKYKKKETLEKMMKTTQGDDRKKAKEELEKVAGEIITLEKEVDRATGKIMSTKKDFKELSAQEVFEKFVDGQVLENKKYFMRFFEKF